MADIKASDVKALRDSTGAGMMDCKKALTEANGDFAKAEKILKEMGLAAVAKRQDRATENGRVFVKVGNGKVVLLSLSCETDFVASNNQFVELGDKLCTKILNENLKEKNNELENMVKDLIAVIKENMNLVKFSVIEIPKNGYATTYIHGEGSVAVAVILTSDKPEVFKNASVEELAHNLALHVAAFKPQFINPKAVNADFENEQLEIFKKQVETDPKTNEKPEKVKEGIVRGKLSKLYKEICFSEQAYVKDDTKSVSQILKDESKNVGANIELYSYAFYQAGVN